MATVWEVVSPNDASKQHLFLNIARFKCDQSTDISDFWRYFVRKTPKYS